MDKKAAVLALLAVWGVGVCSGLTTTAAQAFQPPANANVGAAAEPAALTRIDTRALSNKVWVQMGNDELPGVMKIFLADGTLVQDSCWETHRFSAWEKGDGATLLWNEDGADVTATVLALSQTELVMTIAGGEEQHYVPAEVPFVCPDMQL